MKTKERAPAASKASKGKGAGAAGVKKGISEKPSSSGGGGENARLKSSSEGGGGKTKKPKTPFHMKKALKKKIDLIEQYKQLKAKGALEDFMSKRRKKLFLRDHRLVPRARNEGAPAGK